MWDDSILIALSPILTLVYHCPYYRVCINVFLAENDKKTNQPCNTKGKFQHGNWWRVYWLSNDNRGYSAAKPFVRCLKLKLLKKMWSDLPSIRQDISRTGAQPALVIPNNASLPELHTAAAAAPFVNIDGSGLRICIPVLKRKREKQWECSSISTLKTHLLLQSYNWWIPRKEE